jgi:hypothetical protein
VDDLRLQEAFSAHKGIEKAPCLGFHQYGYKFCNVSHGGSTAALRLFGSQPPAKGNDHQVLVA